MDEVVIPLGTANIKRLIKGLDGFAKSLREGGKTKVRMEQAIAADIADDVRWRIAGIPDVDGNYLGTDNPNASVTVEVGLPGHDVIWRGEQIAFIEWGTGARGSVNLIDPVTMAKAGYHPDPTKARWFYKDAKTGAVTLSRGIPPYAPMFGAAAMMRIRDVYAPAKVILKEEVRRAVTV